MLLLLMSISIVFDLSEKLNEFLMRGAPWDEIIGVYYANFFLFYGTQFSYLLNFISVIWFTSKMANNTEIVPVLSAGVSFNRFLRPYFISAFILMIASLVMYNYVLPDSNQRRLEFEERYYRDRSSRAHMRRVVGENQDKILYIGNYNGVSKVITDFKLQKFSTMPSGKVAMEYEVKAEVAVADSLSNDWILKAYTIRIFSEFRDSGEVNDHIYRGFEVDTTLDFGLKNVIFRSEIIESMNNAELDAFIAKQEASGSEKVTKYKIAKHKRWSSPFAIIVLTVIGVSLSSQRKRGGLGMNIALGLMLCVLYIFSMQITTVAATNVGFTPAVAVWVPNIIFSVIAFYLYKRAPK